MALQQEPGEGTTDRPGLRQTALHGWHVAAGAKMVDFAGWDMPLEYPGGTVAEHRAVRAGCGLFDVSHMGTLLVTGEAAAGQLNALLTNDLGRLSDGQVQYTLLCDEAGGVVDDMLVTRLAADRHLVVPNAANTDAVRRSVAAAVGGALDDLGAGTALIAVQGPASADVLAAVGLPADHDYMTVRTADVAGQEVVVSRTGYTGERGYEVIAPNAVAVELWEELVEQRQAAPCGLGSRDTLRTEMGYPLHGQDIGADISPVAAGLGWAVAWDSRFVGKAALERERAAGPARRLRGIRLSGRGVPRPGMAVGADGAEVGTVTSGTFSPILRAGIALALVDAALLPGADVAVDIRGRSVPGQLVNPPFVSASPR
jgi:aminomethyltransferase